MNEKEKKEFYVSMCKCCLIAEAMKSCGVCNFKVGLPEPVKLVDAIPLSIAAPQTEQVSLQPV